MSLCHAEVGANCRETDKVVFSFLNAAAQYSYKETVVLSFAGFQEVDTRPVHLGVKKDNIKTVALQAVSCEPVGVSNALASDVRGSARLQGGETSLLVLQRRKQDRTGRKQDRKDWKQDPSGVKDTRNRSGWKRSLLVR